MKKSLILANLAALAILLALGCAKAPQEDITAAQGEIDRARQAEAETWAPTEFQAAQDSMNAAQAEITAQNEKWMKNYDKARELLSKAKEDAAKAAEAAVANKEQGKKDADAAISGAQTAIDSAEASLKVAPVTKDSRADLALMKSDLQGAKGSLDEAHQAFETGDYKKALAVASSVKDKATSISDQIEAARKKKMPVRK
ncbi:MAG TPA: hypothetical protein VNL37_02425 [Candidatus Polarisedimenticolia bacterium]|nr:hypothetical protein [Candidatus Polarisedimenticolia bacterium]